MRKTKVSREPLLVAIPGNAQTSTRPEAPTNSNHNLSRSPPLPATPPTHDTVNTLRSLVRVRVRVRVRAHLIIMQLILWQPPLVSPNYILSIPTRSSPHNHWAPAFSSCLMLSEAWQICSQSPQMHLDHFCRAEHGTRSLSRGVQLTDGDCLSVR